MALDIGMDIPRTLVSNDVKRINKEAGSDLKKWIAKPTCGGEYTRGIGQSARKHRAARRCRARHYPAAIDFARRADISCGQGISGIHDRIERDHYRTDGACKLAVLANLPKRADPAIETLD
jgi:hypothetical protein